VSGRLTTAPPAPEESEPERLLEDLEHIADYWEEQARLAQSERRAQLWLKKRDKCRKLAKIIRGSAGR
jgi:hypothetical protein